MDQKITPRMDNGMIRFKQFVLLEMSDQQLNFQFDDSLQKSFQEKMKSIVRGKNPDEFVRTHNKTGGILFKHDDGNIYQVRVIGGKFNFAPTNRALKFEQHKSVTPSKQTSSEKNLGEKWFSHLLSKNTSTPIESPPPTKESENAKKAYQAFSGMFKGGKITKVHHVSTNLGEVSRLTGVSNIDQRKFPHDTIVETEDGKKHGISLKLGDPTWANLSVGSAFKDTDSKLHEALTNHWSKHTEHAKKLAEKISGRQELTNQDLKQLVRGTQRTVKTGGKEKTEYPSAIQTRRDKIETKSANIHASHFNEMSHAEKQTHLRNLLEKDTSTMPLYIVSSYRGGEATNYKDLPFHKQINDSKEIKATVVGKTVHFTDGGDNIIAKAEHRMTHFPSSPQVNIKLPGKREA